jgi:3-phenylpropionate/trans-cinnamate dioxygenase ferredoxin reductase subunit
VRFVIVGNGVAGVTAALTLREREPKAGITIVSGETDYFFSRTALMYAYMNQLPRRSLEPYERKVWDAQRIVLVRDWVTSIGSGEAVLKSGRRLAYDKLLIATGSVPRQADWPGLAAAREGVVHFVSLQDLDACERLTPSTKRAVVAGGGLIGIELVECLRYHGVEVTFLVREPWYWPAALNPEEAGMVTAHIAAHGVDVRFGDEVAEVHADASGRVAGVTTKAGARLDCQMLGICIGVRPATDWLRGSAVAIGRGVSVDSSFRTSVPGVFAAGDCAEIHRDGHAPLIEQIWYSAKRQGRLAALAMLGDAVSYDPPIFFNSSKFFEIEYTTVGEVNRVPDGARHHFFTLRRRHASIRIVEFEERVIGFNMLGSRWNHNQLEQWIAERRDYPYVAARLGDAQFDPEFDRAEIPQMDCTR